MSFRQHGDASKGLQYIGHHGGAGTSTPVIYGWGLWILFSIWIGDIAFKLIFGIRCLFFGNRPFPRAGFQKLADSSSGLLTATLKQQHQQPAWPTNGGPSTSIKPQVSYVNILSQPNHNHNPNNKTTITVVGLRQSNWTIMVFTFVIISKSERRTIGARKTITKKWLTWYIYIPVSFNIIMNRLHNFELSSSCWMV